MASGMSTDLFPLNEQQQAVVDWIVNDKGSLNLIARAGCGKTYTVIFGATRVIVTEELGTVAVTAFNKNAALEFEDRLRVLAQRTGNQDFTNEQIVRPGTVHSFGFSAWRRHNPRYRIKVNGYKVRNILEDMANTDRMHKTIIDEYQGSIGQLVSLAKQQAVGFLSDMEDKKVWSDIIEHHGLDMPNDDEIIGTAIAALVTSTGMDRYEIDFDDMIFSPLYHNAKCEQYDWVLVDEAQDTNASRRALALKMLTPGTGRLIAVGDDKQAIYGFTGADSEAMELIRKELGSKVLPLSITYRCPKAVVREANRLVPDLVADESAPEGVVRQIATWELAVDEGTRPWFIEERVNKDDAVLSRNTKPLISEAYKMIKAGVGCRVEGRDIGEGLINLARKWRGIVSLGVLVDKIEDYRDKEVQKFNSKGQETKAQAIEDKCDTLVLICNNLISQGQTSIRDLETFIRGLFGDTPDGEKPRVVTLSTIHKAKGKEWDRVFILNRRGTIPSKYARKAWQLEQENNLEYVAITRAKKELIDVVDM